MRKLLVLLGCVLLSPAGAKAVIDCSRAVSNVDRMVCSSERLAAAEEHMAQAFRQAMRRGANREQLLASQRDWKINVRDVCNDAQCLLRAFDARSTELDNF
jgi:uncharacterized protein